MYLLKMLFHSMSSERTISFKGIFNCYFRIFPMVKMGLAPEGIEIQQRHEARGILASTFIPAKSFNEYICEEPLVVLIPKYLKKFLLRMVTRNNFTIEVSRRDSWQVKVTFKFNDEAGSASHVLSHTRHQLEPTPVWGGILFNKYPAIKHLINPDNRERNIEISNLNGVALFSVKENNIISTNVGDAGGPLLLGKRKAVVSLQQIFGSEN